MEFNPNERRQQKDAKDQSYDHQRITPTSRRATIGFNPIRDPYEQDRRTSREGNIAQPVDLLVTMRLRCLTQHRIGPNRASDTDRNTDQKDQAPIEIRQNTTQDQPNHRAENPRDLVEDSGTRANTRGTRSPCESGVACTRCTSFLPTLNNRAIIYSPNLSEQEEREPQNLGISNLCNKLFGEAAQRLQIFHTWKGEVDNKLMDTIGFQRRDTLTDRRGTANQSRISETIFPCFWYQG